MYKLKEQTSHSPIGPMSVVYDVEFSDQLKEMNITYRLFIVGIPLTLDF